MSDNAMAPADAAAEGLEYIAQAQERLAAIAVRLAEMVDLKFFAGLTFVEIAALRGIPQCSAQSGWDKTRAAARAAAGLKIARQQDVQPAQRAVHLCHGGCASGQRQGNEEQGGQGMAGFLVVSAAQIAGLPGASQRSARNEERAMKAMPASRWKACCTWCAPAPTGRRATGPMLVSALDDKHPRTLAL